MISRVPTFACVALAALLGAACRKESEPAPRPLSSSMPSAKPLDRLAPGELNPGSGTVFGLAVPNGMQIKGAFLEVAYLEGEVKPEALANYVRDRVEVEHVELGAVSTLFPRARIKEGAPERIYDIEVKPIDTQRTQLVVRDVTPRPKNPPGTSDAERWRQAGYTPDGKPLDPNEMK